MKHNKEPEWWAVLSIFGTLILCIAVIGAAYIGVSTVMLVIEQIERIIP